MKLIKAIGQPFFRALIGKNMLARPEVVEFKETKCIGYSITTSFTDNRKKKGNSPFLP